MWLYNINYLFILIKFQTMLHHSLFLLLQSSIILQTFQNHLTNCLEIFQNIFIQLYILLQQQTIKQNCQSIKQHLTNMHQTNHFQPSERLSQIDENQFMFSPSRITTFNTKDETIKKLQQKNERLRQQINRVQKVLDEPEQKTVYGVKIPQVKRQVTQLELQNAYKRIKAYQHQVQKLKSIKNSGPYIDQVRKAQNLLKQKQDLSQKLRKQLADIKKSSKDLVKQLKNDNKKNSYENKSSQLNTEIKWLRQKVKQAQSRQQIQKKNRQRQTLFIKKLQQELLSSGFPTSSLQAIKSKFTANQTQRTDNSRMSQFREQKQFVQDRTPQAYKISLNQIKLLQKMDNNYNQQLQTLTKQNQEAYMINLKSRNRLLQVQDQIDHIQKRVNQLKTMIDPAKLKPQRALSMQANVGRYGRVNRSLTSIKSAFTHLYKHDQVGKVGKNARRFSDRPKVGKNVAKIIALDLYQSKQEPFHFVGLQATYQIKSAIKKGSLNMIVDSKTANKITLTLVEHEDYIKDIQCIANQKGSIIGVSAASKKGVSGKAGASQGMRRPLNIPPNEYPVCIYGSFSQKGLQLLGVQMFEQK